MRGKRFVLYALAALALVLVIQTIQAPRVAAVALENYGDAKNEGDVLIRSDQPGSNYGGVTQYAAVGQFGGTFRAYYRFAFSIPAPAGVIIDNAFFYTYSQSEGGIGDGTGSRNTMIWWNDNLTWNENTLTWGSVFSTTENHSIETLDSPRTGWTRWNVKTAVENVFNAGGDKITFMLRWVDEVTETTNLHAFRTKEGTDASKHPYLEIYYHPCLPEIVSVSANPTLVDRDANQVGSGASTSVSITIRVRDLDNRDGISSVYIWIQDNADAVIVDNVQVTDNSVINENTLDFTYSFDPPNNLPDDNLGSFDVRVLVVDNTGREDTENYGGMGHKLFTVDDLTVTGTLDTANPIYQVGISGTIARITGDPATADNVRVVDNNEGTLVPDGFGNTSYNDNYGLVSPLRLYRGSQGSVYAWARDDTLDGKSSAQSYTVQGDNVLISKQSISNQPDSSTVTLTVRWGSDSANATSGTVYVQSKPQFSAAVGSGTANLVLDPSSWIYSGAAIVTIYDNADRPLWNVTTATFETKSITYTASGLTGTGDSATVRVTLTYKYEGTIPSTAQSKLAINGVALQYLAPDENGIISWSGVDLPDNAANIQLVLENVYDNRTDYVVNAKDAEDKVVYYENTTCSFMFTDNDKTVYYGATATTLDGTLTSRASYVTLTVRENLCWRDNAAVVDNKSTVLSPGASAAWSFSVTPTETENYTIRWLSPGGALMWAENARVTVRLSAPAPSSPDNNGGTSDNTSTLVWGAITGASGYHVQLDNDSGFGSITWENTPADNSDAVPNALGENLYYWRVLAASTIENVENSGWSGVGNFYVDWTSPTLDNLSGSDAGSATASLTLGATDNLSGVYQVRMSELENFAGASWQAYASPKTFACGGYGTRTVYAQVRDRAGNLSNVRSASVTLSAPSPPPIAPSQPSGSPQPTPDTTPPLLTLLSSVPNQLDTPSTTIQISVSDISPITSVFTALNDNLVPNVFTNNIVTISLDNLRDGSYALIVRVKDSENNLGERTISFSVRLPPTPVPIEDSLAEAVGENVPGALTERLRVENVPAGQQVKFTFATAVTGVTLVPSENVEDMVLGVVMYDNLPNSTLPPFDNAKLAYCYFEVTLNVDGSENYQTSMASFTFEFKVEKAWMENENVTDVKLYRLRDNSWQTLLTRFVRDDYEYRYYGAEVPGLSMFSIVGIRSSVAAGQSSISIAVPPKEIPQTTLLAGLFAGIGALGGGVFYYIRRYLPKRARVEVRRELKEGPYLQEIKRSFGPLIEKRVRELEQKMGFGIKNLDAARRGEKSK